MKKQLLCVAGSLTLALSGSASAGLVNVTCIYGPDQHPDGLHDTWQVIASFSNASDRISAVNGLTEPGLNQLVFYLFSGELYNQDLFDGLPFNDFPSGAIGGEAYDSYVTIGATNFPHNTQFTPNFLGDWGGAPPPVSVITGSSFTEDDGAWFFFGTPPEVGSLPDAVQGNDTFDVVIAQFTFDAGDFFYLEANLAWLNAMGDSFNTPFEVDPLSGCIPSPGALSLFGFAGLVGINRRRRK